MQLSKGTGGYKTLCYLTFANLRIAFVSSSSGYTWPHHKPQLHTFSEWLMEPDVIHGNLISDSSCRCSICLSRRIVSSISKGWQLCWILWRSLTGHQSGSCCGITTRQILATPPHSSLSSWTKQLLQTNDQLWSPQTAISNFRVNI